MQKKILFISYDGMTDPLGQSQVIPYLQGLSKKGFYFYLLSCEKPAVFEKNKAAVKKELEGYNIEWHPITYTKNPPVISSVKDFYDLKQKAAGIYRLHKVDMVHSRPGIPALVGLWMKKKYGLPFLHDIREFFADSRVEGGIWNLNNPLYRTIYNYFKRKEKEELAFCDGIVCLTRAGEKITRAMPGFQNGTPLKVIPCSADLGFFSPEKIKPERKQQLRKELGIAEGDMVISYLGSVGGWYLTADMLRFCKLVADKLPTAKFLFITPHLHDTIKTESIKAGLSAGRLIIKNSMRTDIPLLLSLSNYSLFFIKPCFSKLSSSPTKHGEIMAMGIPVITNSGVGDVKEIVEKYHAGFVLNDFSDSAFNEVISNLNSGTQFNHAEIQKGAEEWYSLEKAISSYRQLYEEILSKKK